MMSRRGALFALALVALSVMSSRAQSPSPALPVVHRPPRRVPLEVPTRPEIDPADLLGRWDLAYRSSRATKQIVAGVATSRSYEFSPDGAFRSLRIDLPLGDINATHREEWRGRWSLQGSTLTLRNEHRSESDAVDSPLHPTDAKPFIGTLTISLAGKTDSVFSILRLNGVRYQNRALHRFTAMAPAARQDLLTQADAAALQTLSQTGTAEQAQRARAVQAPSWRLARRAALLALIPSVPNGAP